MQLVQQDVDNVLIVMKITAVNAYKIMHFTTFQTHKNIVVHPHVNQITKNKVEKIVILAQKIKFLTQKHWHVIVMKDFSNQKPLIVLLLIVPMDVFLVQVKINMTVLRVHLIMCIIISHQLNNTVV